MAAEQIVDRPMELLFEPAKPRRDQRATHGWRRVHVIRDRVSVTELERDHADDSWGAVVQHIICRYVLEGEQRNTLAREHGLSERQVQAYLVGEAWQPYSRPVLAWLQDMGVSAGRGNWQGKGPRTRPAELIAALQRVSRLAVDVMALDRRPHARRIAADLRLLSGAWREVRP